MRSNGIGIVREPGALPGTGKKICAVRDPDDWKIVFVDEHDFEKELQGKLFFPSFADP